MDPFGLGGLIKEIEKRLGTPTANVVVVLITIALVVVILRLVAEYLIFFTSLQDSEAIGERVTGWAGYAFFYIGSLYGFHKWLEITGKRHYEEIEKHQSQVEKQQSQVEELLEEAREILRKAEQLTEQREVREPRS